MHRFRFPAALLLAAALFGCMPAIYHGPRVDDGAKVAVVASLSPVTDYHIGEGDDASLFGATGAVFGYGWAARSEDAPGYHVGLHLSVMGARRSHADLYVQMPSRYFGEHDAGLGLAAGPGTVMPYAQFGRTRTDGSGWYLTPGALFTRTTPNSGMGHSGWAALVTATRVWTATSGANGQLFLTAGYGGRTSRCHGVDPMCQAPPGRTGIVGTIGGGFDLLRWGQRDRGR